MTPTAPPAITALFSTELLLRAQGRGGGLRAVFLDVDGVLTDGRLWIGAEGETVKAFHVLDGQGLKLLRSAGIEPVIVTGRDSAAVRRRVADLGLAEAHYGVADKLAVATPWLQARGLGWDEVAAMGDDWPDLPLLERAALAVAPPAAHAEVLQRAHHITRRGGGEGAVRELCDLLLLGANRYAALLAAQRQTLDAR